MADPQTVVSRSPSHLKTWGLIIAALVLLAAILIYVFTRPEAEPAPADKTAAQAEEPSAELGAEVYNKANNPLADKLPGSGASVPNPLEGSYRNPFE